jgi:hypothetical protein
MIVVTVAIVLIVVVAVTTEEDDRMAVGAVAAGATKSHTSPFFFPFSQI